MNNKSLVTPFMTLAMKEAAKSKRTLISTDILVHHILLYQSYRMGWEYSCRACLGFESCQAIVEMLQLGHKPKK